MKPIYTLTSHRITLYKYSKLDRKLLQLIYTLTLLRTYLLSNLRSIVHGAGSAGIARSGFLY